MRTRRALIAAAIETLAEDGFAGASARRIAARAQCNQALVFYHFGSVANLLLAALDAVSVDRLARYGDVVAQASTVSELAGVAQAIFEEDLDAGYVTVLVELIGGARSIPGFGEEISERIKVWTDFAQQAIDAAVDPVLLAATLPSSEIAYAAVAMYLGLEMLTHLDGDRSGATALFERGRHLLGLAEVLGILPTHGRGETL
ncbi:MAG: TetR family transcriptional regulator [Actinomycetota bacterium]|nr:TetR family transcriptional regulator [Actinomycetota bacterium]